MVEIPAAETGIGAEKTMDVRTRRLLEGPIVPLLLNMSWPNVLIMLAQASTGLIETWWLSWLGTDALAGMALVFPPIMLVTMISAGAVGGGISSAVARALGAGKQKVANALVLHAIVLNAGLSLVFSLVFLVFGENIYRRLGGSAGDLQAALQYSNVVFGANIFIWLLNGLASVVRGTGNMWFPATVACVGALFLIPVSPLLIYGFGPIPALGVVGGGVALILYNVAGTLALGWYIFSGRNTVHFKWVTLKWEIFASILRIGAISAVMAVFSNVIIGAVTAMVASRAGVEGVAGFGTGARLEYLLVPLIFGIGAPLVPMVGMNIGAGQQKRALEIGLTGGTFAFILAEVVGLSAALFPTGWMSLFTHDHQAIETGASYLRIVGPFYGFYGLGLSLYFASQGAGRLKWPVSAGVLRILVALGGGWIVLQATASLHAVFWAMSASLLIYGLFTVTAIRSGVWFDRGR